VKINPVLAKPRTTVLKVRLRTEPEAGLEAGTSLHRQ